MAVRNVKMIRLVQPVYSDGGRWSENGKERKSIYIAPFMYYVYLKALGHGSHSFTCKYTMPDFSS